jgi:hypothetical protein
MSFITIVSLCHDEILLRVIELEGKGIVLRQTIQHIFQVIHLLIYQLASAVRSSIDIIPPGARLTICGF